jgi:hypothetical protein
MEFNLEFKENFLQRKCNENFDDFKQFLFKEMKFKENKNIMKIYYKNENDDYIEINNENDFEEFKKLKTKIIKISDLNEEKNNLINERNKRKFELLKYIRKNKYNSIVIENSGVIINKKENTIIFNQNENEKIFFPSMKNFQLN